MTRASPLPAAPTLTVGQLAIERSAPAQQDMRATRTRAALLILAPSTLVELMLDVNGVVALQVLSASMQSSLMRALVEEVQVSTPPPLFPRLLFHVSSLQGTVPFASVPMATPVTRLSAVMLTHALRVLAELMQTVSPMATERCASVGRAMRATHLSTAA